MRRICAEVSQTVREIAAARIGEKQKGRTPPSASKGRREEIDSESRPKKTKNVHTLKEKMVSMDGILMAMTLISFALGAVRDVVLYME